MFYSNGDKYDGEWMNDLKQGDGKYVWKNGSRYEGEWLDDLMDGLGTYFDETGNKITALWIENAFYQEYDPDDESF